MDKEDTVKATLLHRPSLTEAIGHSQHSLETTPERMGEVQHGGDVAFSPDGRHLAVSHSKGPEGPVAIWDVQRAPELKVVRRLARSRNALGWLDDHTLAIGWKDGIAHYNPFTDDLLSIRSIKGRWGFLSAGHVFPEPGGQRILAATSSGSAICMFDQQRALWRTEAHGHESLTTAQWHPSGQWVFTGGCDRWIRVWSADTGERVQEIEQPPSNWLSTPFSLSPDGSRLICRDHRFGAQVLAAPSWEVVRTLPALGGPVSCFRWGPDNRIAIGTECPTNKKTGGGLQVWSANTWTRLDHATWRGGRWGPFASGVAWSPDGKRLAVVDFYGQVRLFKAPAPDQGEAEPAVVHPRERTGALNLQGGFVSIFLNIDTPSESPAGVLGWYDHDFAESGAGGADLQAALQSFSYGASFAEAAAQRARELGVTSAASIFLLYDHRLDREAGPFHGGTFLGDIRFSRS